MDETCRFSLRVNARVTFPSSPSFLSVLVLDVVLQVTRKEDILLSNLPSHICVTSNKSFLDNVEVPYFPPPNSSWLCRVPNLDGLQVWRQISLSAVCTIRTPKLKDGPCWMKWTECADLLSTTRPSNSTTLTQTSPREAPEPTWWNEGMNALKSEEK